MKRIKILLSLIFIINTLNIFAQVDSVLDFWPVHKGDIWQYRAVSTNEVDHTVIIDSVINDSLSKNRIVYEGGWTSKFYNHYRIDTLGNVYERGIDSEYVRYKLYADSADTWVDGFFNGDTVVVNIFNVYSTVILGVNTAVKAYRFETTNKTNPFSFGDDYLAKGFGLIRSDIEAGDILYLAGAIINGKKYGVITSVNEQTPIPKSYDLITNYPNPFNNSTIISYTIETESNVKISIYDILGKKVKELMNEKKEKGTYKTRFNANDLSSGIYFLVLKANSNILTHKICLLK